VVQIQVGVEMLCAISAPPAPLSQLITGPRCEDETVREKTEQQ